MEESSVIKTTRILPSITGGALMLYFKKWRKSEGLEVTRVDMNRNEETALVHFKGPKLKPELLQKSHKIGGVTFYTSLCTEWLKVPPPFSLQDLDPQKIRFIKDSVRNLLDLERQLQDIYTTVEFGAENSVILKCCLTKDVPDAKHRADSWEVDVRRQCQQFFSSLVNEQIFVPLEIRSNVITAIGDLQIPNPDEAVVHSYPETGLIVVVGHKVITEKLMEELKDIIQKAQNAHRYRTEQTTQTKTVKLWQLRLLKKVNFDSDMSRKYQNLKIVFDLNKKITFSGVLCDVESACKDLRNTMHIFRKEPLPNLSQVQLMLVQKRCVEQYIEKKLENINGMFETRNSEVRVYSTSQTVSRYISDVFTQSLVEQVIRLDSEATQLVESPEWKKICGDLTRTVGDVFEIVVAEDKSRIVIAATDAVIEDVTKKMERIIKNKTVYEDTVNFPIGIHRFLTEYMGSEIDKVARSLQGYSVEVHKDSEHFSLKGTKDGLKIVKEKLITFSTSIVSDTTTFNSPGIIKLILSEKGREQIRQIGANERCVIEPRSEYPMDISETLPDQQGNMRHDQSESCDDGIPLTMSSSETGDQNLSHCRGFTADALDEGRSPRDYSPPEVGVESSAPIEIVIIEEDITTQQTDVIVNSASPDLQLRNGSLSKSILLAAGVEMQHECEDRYPTGIPAGQFAITGGGKLWCQHVYHACLPAWKDGTQCCRVLQEVISDCLQEASQEGHKTIAFPALGTGNLGYPNAMVAETMMATVERFSQGNPDSSLEEVKIVVFNDTSIFKLLQIFQRQKKKTDDEKMKITAVKNRKNRIFDIDAMEGATVEATEELRTQPETKVFVHMFSDDIMHVETAVSLLETFVNEAITTKNISDDQLKNANLRQDKIRKLSSKHCISVDYNHMLGKVELQGLTSDVMAATDAVHTIVKAILLQQKQDEKAKLISSYARWGYTDLSGAGAIQDYDIIINQKIEDAHVNEKPTLCLPVIDGKVYVLDLKKMEEYDLYNDADRVRVIRKDLSKGSAFDAPSHWCPMHTESEQFEVNKETTEYTKVEKTFIGSVGRERSILKIERVQTQSLWRQYAAMKQRLEKQNPGHNNEKVLWHGTSMDGVPFIAKNGFNRSYCGKNATAYGKGVYFAVDASYSDMDQYAVPDGQGHKQMFLARVLTGMYCKGAEQMKVPPTRDSKNQILYDSVVNKVDDPGMFIIFNDTQAYPEYLITYR
ncbi:protein mono-ADP-ribosyltransferase PARP14-like isoform X2 [Haliotis rufescens]|uniref:protein mono-ADP-ribosyltransferase PARP14-like isoform X2 n=1 Tax=Haliotis rufescens TaxID=6454 RepID=UPI00201EB4DA|nr:protein mono-ADP-ribosyltransferase PARP14-like isoform X2 [Haliotis rufescens]